MHLVIVDGTTTGVLTLAAALRKGHRVTFIHTPQRLFAHTFQGDAGEEVVARLSEVITIEDTTDPEAVAAAVRDVHGRHPVDAVFTTLHECVEATTHAAHCLGLLSTSKEGARISCQKDAARARLVEREIPSIRYELVESADAAQAAAQRLGFPVVVKPSRGVAKLFTKIAQNQAEVAQAFKAYHDERHKVEVAMRRTCDGPLLMEEYMPGRMLSAEVGATSNRAFLIGLGERNRAAHNELIELGSTYPAPLSETDYASVRDYALRVVEAFELETGVFHVEIMLTAAGPRLIELNPRHGGAGIGQAIGASLGIDFYDLLVDIYSDESVTLPSPSSTILIKPLASKHGGVVDAYDLTWLDEYQDHLLYFVFQPKPGDEVPPIRSNFDYIGYMLLRAQDANTCNQLAEEILERLSSSFGVEMAR